jgi:hypothetical protein
MPLSLPCRLVFAAAGLTFTLSFAAERAALAASSEDPCDAMLTRLSKVGESRGYSVGTGAFGFTAIRNETELDARCSAGHLAVALLEGDGSGVDVIFRRRAGENFALEILGQFPEIGTVARTALIDASAEPIAALPCLLADRAGDGV